ncbi:rCG23629 [Rattus norvegicus]|uniref:RCG23629 n=1 Tax=Rattus norvegicus TaxID=10116 RepID=A6KJP5_RAT|nr:rCG23629 [Rattus norvegicus]
MKIDLVRRVLFVFGRKINLRIFLVSCTWASIAPQ